MIRDFGDRTELVLEMWSRVKGDNLNTGIVLLIFAVFGLLFIWLVYAKIRKYKQKRLHSLRRKRKRGLATHCLPKNPSTCKEQRI
mgnify:FL=1